MNKIPEDVILEFRPETLEDVRKEFDLDKPGRVKDALDILENWIQKQAHFRRKDYSRDYLERTLITSKGSVERTKQRLDKLCTIKTLMPEFFSVTDVWKELAPLSELVHHAILPKLTKLQNRVFLFRVIADFESEDLFGFYTNVIMLAEYLKNADYCNGFIVIADLRDINLMTIMTKVNPIRLAQVVSLLTEGYGLRLKGVFIISDSRIIDTVISFIKQGLSQKIGDKIQTVKSENEVYERVPQELWPVDYGGQERSLKKLNDDWLSILSSPENMARYIEMNQFRTDESYRPAAKLNEAFMGLPGSFRALSVD